MYTVVYSGAHGLSIPMNKAQQTLMKHGTSIRNSLKHRTTNGPLEGTNNLFKVFKRIAFG